MPDQNYGDLATAFERDGVVCVRNLASQQWAGRLRDAVEEVLANAKAGAEVNGHNPRVGVSRADTTIIPGEPLDGEAFPLLWPSPCSGKR